MSSCFSMVQRRSAGPASARGFSYAEILLSVVLLTVLLVPALESLNNAILGSDNNLAARQLKLRSKMEEVLSKPYADLSPEAQPCHGNTATSVSANLSDASDTADRRVVVLYWFKAATNGCNPSDTGLLWVSVYFEADGSATALNTLVGGRSW